MSQTWTEGSDCSAARQVPCWVILFASVSFQHPIYLYAIRYVILPCAAKICPDLIWSCKPSETKIIVEIFCLEFYENSFYCGCKDSEFLNALSVLLPTFSNLGNKIWSKKYPRLRWGLHFTSWCKSDQFNFFFSCHMHYLVCIWDSW